MGAKLSGALFIFVAVGLVAGGRVVLRSRPIPSHLAAAPLAASIPADGGSSVATSGVKYASESVSSPLAIDPKQESAAASARRDIGAEWLTDFGQSNDAGFPACYKCFRDYECKLGEGCAIDRATGHLACVTGNCTRDEDCLGGWSCTRVGRERGILRCVEHGSVHEGEPCNYDPTGARYACEPGLVCLDNRCAVPCPARVCKAGRVCVDSPDGPACAPPKVTCHTTGCPKGLRCEHTGGDDFMCVGNVKGTNCFQHPCAKGESCQVAFGPQVVEFWCGTLCDPLAPTCQPGFVCGQSRMNETESLCYPACVDRVYCPKGQVCGTISEDRQTWGCMPHPGPKPSREGTP